MSFQRLPCPFFFRLMDIFLTHRDSEEVFSSFSHFGDFSFWPFLCRLWNLTSLTGDGTQAHSSESVAPNPGDRQEAPTFAVWMRACLLKCYQLRNSQGTGIQFFEAVHVPILLRVFLLLGFFVVRTLQGSSLFRSVHSLQLRPTLTMDCTCSSLSTLTPDCSHSCPLTQ